MSDQLHSIPQVDVDQNKIRLAVKEALDDKAMEDLKNQLTNLSTQVAEGFAKSHQRHDIANGKLARHDIQLENLEKAEEVKNRRTTFWQRNQDKMVWGMVGVGLMLFYYLLTQSGFPAFLG